MGNTNIFGYLGIGYVCAMLSILHLIRLTGPHTDQLTRVPIQPSHAACSNPLTFYKNNK